MLRLVRQGCVAEERAVIDSEQRNVAVVIKHSPFIIHVSYQLPPHASIDNVVIACTLCYVTADCKPVDYVRICPIDYRTVPCEIASCIAVEIKIKVLTSQLEDSLFKILFQGLDSTTFEPIPTMRCESEPIRVVSKPEQIKKGKKDDGKINLTPVRMTTGSHRSQNVQTLPTVVNTVPNVQMNMNSMTNQMQPGIVMTDEVIANFKRIHDCINRIHALQMMQTNNIHKLLKGGAPPQNTVNASDPSTPSSEIGKRQRECDTDISEGNTDVFCKEVTRLLGFYKQLLNEQTPFSSDDKVKAAVNAALQEVDTETLSELCDMLESGGLARRNNLGPVGMFDVLPYNANFIL